MSYIEEKEKMLLGKIIPQTKKDDFNEFWEDAVNSLRKIPLKVERKKLDLPFRLFDTYEVTFNTHDDTIVTGYFTVPCGYEGKKLPCVAYFYGGGGYGSIKPEITATGVCCFTMDTRSQGGKTFDDARYKMMDDYRGAIMTHDILYKDNFYMKNIYLDAVRVIDVISTFSEVDENKIVTFGASQGGALSIAAAALSGKVLKTFPAVTSYSCLKERTEAASGVFGAVHNYLNLYPEKTDDVMDTLSYFDINNLVSLLKCPATFLLGLADPICIPEFVYSAYHHTPSEKEIVISPFTHHEVTKDFKLKVLCEVASL